MDDAISRQAVLKLLSTIPPEEAMTKALLIQSVKQMKSAQPEIIMCADCKKYIDYRCRDEHANLSDWRHEDDYCSYAERREESETDG